MTQPDADAPRDATPSGDASPLRIDIVTLFPEMYAGVLGTSIPARAAAKGLVTYTLTDIRTFGEGNYTKVDDRPFGGGPGMVMLADVLARATDHALALDPRPTRRILLTPAGVPFNHAKALELSKAQRLLLVATRYEGYDERFREEYDLEEVSLGDFVLSGGELAAMVVIDAVVRLLPGALGHDDGSAHESFSSHAGGLLEAEQFTRPRLWRGRDVPQVLMGGDHAKIEAWRQTRRVERTRERRPDLMPDRDT